MLHLVLCLNMLPPPQQSACLTKVKELTKDHRPDDEAEACAFEVLAFALCISGREAQRIKDAGGHICMGGGKRAQRLVALPPCRPVPAAAPPGQGHLRVRPGPSWLRAALACCANCALDACARSGEHGDSWQAHSLAGFGHWPRLWYQR